LIYHIRYTLHPYPCSTACSRHDHSYGCCTRHGKSRFDRLPKMAPVPAFPHLGYPHAVLPAPPPPQPGTSGANIGNASPLPSLRDVGATSSSTRIWRIGLPRHRPTAKQGRAPPTSGGPGAIQVVPIHAALFVVVFWPGLGLEALTLGCSGIHSPCPFRDSTDVPGLENRYVICLYAIL